MLAAGDDLVEVTRLAVEARERDRRPLRPDRPRRTRRRRLRPQLRDVAADGAARPRAAAAATSRIDGRRIALERGFRLDLGGIAKGYAVDRAAGVLAQSGPALVNAGGDLAGRGRLWPVGVETGDGELTLGLEDHALATSGCDRRRWRRGGIEAHHLIDPATGAPAETRYLRVTVTAPTAVEAEIQAKAVFLGAEPEGLAVLITADGRTVLAGGLA